jgi:predicted transcriptional regulator
MEALRLFGAGNTHADIARALGRSKSMIRLYLNPAAYKVHLEKCTARCRTEKYKESKQQWYKEHREEWNAYQREYRAKRADKMREYFSKYRQEKAAKLRVIRNRYERNKKTRLRAEKRQAKQLASVAPADVSGTAAGTP